MTKVEPGDASSPEAVWRAAVAAVLGGKDAASLRFVTTDGISVEPLYPATSVEPAPGSNRDRPCRVVQPVDHPDLDEARALLGADLDGGADGLTLRFAGAGAARGFGLPVCDDAALARLLAAVPLDRVAIRLETPPFAGSAIRAALADAVTRLAFDPGTARLDFGIDPIGAMARLGSASAAWPTLAARAATSVLGLRDKGFVGPVLRADGRAFHEAGASEGQELASVIAAGVAYMRALEADGIGLDDARRAIGFVLVTEVDTVVTTAKFRALRRLWARIEEACGLEPAPAPLHAETAWRALSRRDPWTNLLRGTTGCFGAMIGGADSIEVLPFTAALGLPDAAARRLARNTSLILREEGSIGTVTDPARGAGAFEALTDAFCETAWRLFGALERAGGLPEALARGAWQGEIAATRAKRAAAVACRTLPITGTSTFADVDEPLASVLFPAPRSDAGLAAATGTGSLQFAPLVFRRDAEPYERLRDASDRALAETGRRPGVVLVVFADATACREQLAFAEGAFATGGIETVVVATSDRANAALEPVRGRRNAICLVPGLRQSRGYAHTVTATGASHSGGPARPGRDGSSRHGPVVETCEAPSAGANAGEIEATARRLRTEGWTVVLLAEPPESGEHLLRAGLVDGLLFDGCDLVALMGRVIAPTPNFVGPPSL